MATGSSPNFFGHLEEMQAIGDATRMVGAAFIASFDPVGAGMVASLSRPGGNVTGMSLQSSELAGKRLEILKELIPSLSKVAVLVNPGDPVAKLQMERAEVAARNLRIELGPVLRFHAHLPRLGLP